jgi:hypothetical protein
VKISITWQFAFEREISQFFAWDYTINRTLHQRLDTIYIIFDYTVAWRYDFYLLVLKTIFYSLAALVRKILFSPLEDKSHIFAPPCNILYICPFLWAFWWYKLFCKWTKLKVHHFLQYNSFIIKLKKNVLAEVTRKIGLDNVQNCYVILLY